MARTLFQPLEEQSFVEFSALLGPLAHQPAFYTPHTRTQSVQSVQSSAIDSVVTEMPRALLDNMARATSTLAVLLKIVFLLGILFSFETSPYSVAWSEMRQALCLFVLVPHTRMFYLI